MWDHLYPCRTQKLSTYTPKVLVWRRTGRIGSCWLEPYICKALIFCCSFTFDLYELCLYIEVAKNVRYPIRQSRGTTTGNG